MKASRRIASFVVTCLALCLASAFALAGCSSSQEAGSSTASGADATAAAPVELQVFAANSLYQALPEVQALYAQEHGNVSFADTQFEASGTLVSKLQAGARADVLITASKGTMDKAGVLVDEDTRVDMFCNDLVVCAQEGSELAVSSLEELASDDAIESIAIGDPNVVPAGDYAVQAFESAGLATCERDADGKYLSIEWDASIADKIHAGADKVGTVATYVSEGACTVGVVYSSDIIRYQGVEGIYVVPEDAHKTILYPGAVVAESAHAAVAADFIDFCLTNPQAQAIFAQYGFELV